MREFRTDLREKLERELKEKEEELKREMGRFEREKIKRERQCFSKCTFDNSFIYKLI